MFDFHRYARMEAIKSATPWSMRRHSLKTHEYWMYDKCLFPTPPLCNRKYQHEVLGRVQTEKKESCQLAHSMRMLFLRWDGLTDYAKHISVRTWTRPMPISCSALKYYFHNHSKQHNACPNVDYGGFRCRCMCSGRHAECWQFQWRSNFIASTPVFDISRWQFLAIGYVWIDEYSFSIHL